MSWDHQTVKFGSMPIHRDSRGTLAVAEFAPLPFLPRRLFWLIDITPGRTRANHAHRVCEQLVFVQAGSVSGDILTPDARSLSFHLNLGDWVVIPTRHWLSLRDFAPHSIVGVFASHPFDAEEYIESPDDLSA